MLLSNYSSHPLKHKKLEGQGRARREASRRRVEISLAAMAAGESAVTGRAAPFAAPISDQRSLRQPITCL